MVLKLKLFLNYQQTNTEKEQTLAEVMTSCEEWTETDSSTWLRTLSASMIRSPQHTNTLRIHKLFKIIILTSKLHLTLLHSKPEKNEYVPIHSMLQISGCTPSGLVLKYTILWLLLLYGCSSAQPKILYITVCYVNRIINKYTYYYDIEQSKSKQMLIIIHFTIINIILSVTYSILRRSVISAAFLSMDCSSYHFGHIVAATETVQVTLLWQNGTSQLCA